MDTLVFLRCTVPFWRCIVQTLACRCRSLSQPPLLSFQPFLAFMYKGFSDEIWMLLSRFYCFNCLFLFTSTSLSSFDNRLKSFCLHTIERPGSSILIILDHRIENHRQRNDDTRTNRITVPSLGLHMFTSFHVDQSPPIPSKSSPALLHRDNRSSVC